MELEAMILYEDDDFIAVNKPSGMLVIPDRFDRSKENLYDALNEKYGKVYVVHRLDRDTSGIVIFAKNPEAHRDLSMKWEAGEVEKTYFAIVKGTLREKTGTVNLGLSPLKKKKGLMVVDARNGKRSVTNYKVIEEFKDHSLLEVKPKTGRTHQIRVHMAAIGNPLDPDPLYNRREAIGRAKREGPAKKEKELKKGRNYVPTPVTPPISRLPLHAYRISFFHFRLNRKIEIESAMPGDMKNAVDILGLQKFFGGKDKRPDKGRLS